MNIVLVYPPDDPRSHRRQRKSGMLGLLYVAAAVREAGHSVQVVDLQPWPNGDVRREQNGGMIRSSGSEDVFSNADLIGVAIPFSHTAEVGHDLVAEIKSGWPCTPVVLGGAYPSSQPDMAVQSGADFLVLGEGEGPLAMLARALEDGASTAAIPGVYDASDAGRAGHISPYHAENVDAIPHPARDIVNFHDYARVSQRNINDVPSASIFTSRGCPYDCEFCSIHSVFGRRWRPRCVDSVVDEIKSLVHEYGIRNLEIEDDNFTLAPDRAYRVLAEIRKCGIDDQAVTWTAPNGLRVDSLDSELIEMIAASGCRYVFLALEHGDQHMLNDVIGKRLDLARVMEVVSLFGKHRIQCFVFALFGYPGETRGAFARALSYYRQLKHAHKGLEFAFLLPEPYPATRLWTRSIERRWIDSASFSSPSAMAAFYHTDGPWIITPELSRDEVMRRGALLRSEFSSSQTYVELIDGLPPSTDAHCNRIPDGTQS